MKIIVLIGAALATSSGCVGNSVPRAVDVPVTAAEPGVVVIDPQSPMLRQLRRETAVTRELPTDEVVAPGKIEANPNRVAKVALPVTGRVRSVLVGTGDAVVKDQPLLTIQSPDADAAISGFLSAQAAVTQMRAGLGKAQGDFDRASDLFEHNAVAKKDVLGAESALAQAKAGLEQAQAALRQLERRLAVLGLVPGEFNQEVVVRAPLSGKVLDLSVVPGEFRNDTSASVMTIADLSTVWVTSQVPESYIRFVQPGERVEIGLIAYPGETFQGRVLRIADTVEPQTRTVKVQAEMDNRNARFRPEMYGSIHHVESVARMRVVPFAAVFEDGSRTAVFVERAPGQLEERTVAIGKRAGDVVRIVSGVKSGESVVTDGVMLLKGLIKRN